MLLRIHNISFLVAFSTYFFSKSRSQQIPAVIQASGTQAATAYAAYYPSLNQIYEASKSTNGGNGFPTIQSGGQKYVCIPLPEDAIAQHNSAPGSNSPYSISNGLSQLGYPFSTPGNSGASNSLTGFPGGLNSLSNPSMPTFSQFPGIPSLPQFPGNPSIPLYPGTPSLPQFLGNPGIPQFPGIPNIPQLPMMSQFPGMGNPFSESTLTPNQFAHMLRQMNPSLTPMEALQKAEVMMKTPKYNNSDDKTAKNGTDDKTSKNGTVYVGYGNGTVQNSTEYVVKSINKSLRYPIRLVKTNLTETSKEFSNSTANLTDSEKLFFSFLNNSYNTYNNSVNPIQQNTSKSDSARNSSQFSYIPYESKSPISFKPSKTYNSSTKYPPYSNSNDKSDYNQGSPARNAAEARPSSANSTAYNADKTSKNYNSDMESNNSTRDYSDNMSKTPQSSASTSQTNNVSPHQTKASSSSLRKTDEDKPEKNMKANSYSAKNKDTETKNYEQNVKSRKPDKYKPKKHSKNSSEEDESKGVLGNTVGGLLG